MLTLAKACLSDGKKLSMAAYQVPPIKDPTGWNDYRYPVEVVLLCRPYLGDPGYERGVLTFHEAQQRLVPGELLTLFGFGEEHEWVQPDAIGFIYAVVDTQGLHEVNYAEQFMVKIRHINHPQEVVGESEVTEDMEQQRLLARINSFEPSQDTQTPYIELT